MKTMKTLLSLILVLALCLTLAACAPKEKADYTIGICNYVDDASLNQIVSNIRSRLEEISKERGVTIEVLYNNCNTDSALLGQIVSDFLVDKVDLMVAIATPVAMEMQSRTEDSKTPVVFAAVSDPLGTGLVSSMEKPGANLTGTSDFLDTNAVMNLIFAQNPNAKKIGLLYDVGQESSKAAIDAAKEFLKARNVEFVEANGTNTVELSQSVEELIRSGVDAVFTPTDNTVMEAELAIYEKFINAKIPHYTGADSFALNGAFLGYGVDYANLGVETANMVAKILLDGAKPSELSVMTFDNGTATVNVETCTGLGYDYEEIAKTFAPLCTKVQQIKTADNFDDLKD